jgi:tRNA-2-methylthio-N6-dimethylallyladenosine synthase
MNLADSETIGGLLEREGYRTVSTPEDADVILVNTCAIREHAETRVAQRVRQLIAARRDGRRVRVGLAGCMAQHHRNKLLDAIDGLDFVVGPDGYRRLPELIESEELAADVRLDRNEMYDDVVPNRQAGVRAWVTIMRGCDRFCTFCVVPYVRGRERCSPPDAIVEQIQRATDAGYPEIVLLGQTVNSYKYGEVDFAELLTRCAQIEGVRRIRFTSPHPADMTERAIQAMRKWPTIAPYLHLPLQSGSDRILAAMERGHTLQEYLNLVSRLREAIPDLSLSTDIIVGYPGETEEDFEVTSRVMEEVGYDHAFLFKYSPREGTRSVRIPETVSDQQKAERLTRLIAEQEARALRIHQRLVGTVTEVLVEAPAKRPAGWLSGKNPQFKTVVFEPATACIGSFARVRIEAAGSHTLKGRELPA